MKNWGMLQSSYDNGIIFRICSVSNPQSFLCAVTNMYCSIACKYVKLFLLTNNFVLNNAFKSCHLECLNTLPLYGISLLCYRHIPFTLRCVKWYVIGRVAEAKLVKLANLAKCAFYEILHAYICLAIIFISTFVSEYFQILPLS